MRALPTPLPCHAPQSAMRAIEATCSTCILPLSVLEGAEQSTEGPSKQKRISKALPGAMSAPRERLLHQRLTQLIQLISDHQAEANSLSARTGKSSSILQVVLHRFSKECQFFAAQLERDQLPLPLPSRFKRQISTVLKTGLFEKPRLNDIHLSLLDARNLLFATEFPLLAWQAHDPEQTVPAQVEYSQPRAPATQMLWTLYDDIVCALKTGHIDRYLNLVQAALYDNDKRYDRPHGHHLSVERLLRQQGINQSDYQVHRLQDDERIARPVLYPGLYLLTDRTGNPSVQIHYTDNEGIACQPNINLMLGWIDQRWQVAMLL